MSLHRRYSLLVVPEDEGAIRQVKVARWTLLAAALAVAFCLALAGLYAYDLVAGVAWRPGGAPLARENAVLRGHVAEFETQMARLESSLGDVLDLQERVARAVDLPVMPADALAAGVGGREPLLGTDPRAPEITVETRSLATGLDQLVRQARLQRHGLTAILDSLQARAEVRDHMPSVRPCDIGWLSSRFGMRRDPFTGRQAFHRGLDYCLPLGSPVRVTADGVVTTVEKQRGLGLVVKVNHGNGVMTVYGHLKSASVKKGQTVSRGDVIAASGNTGRSTGPHLHYEVRVDGRSVNPISYILDRFANGR